MTNLFSERGIVNRKEFPYTEIEQRLEEGCYVQDPQTNLWGALGPSVNPSKSRLIIPYESVKKPVRVQYGFYRVTRPSMGGEYTQLFNPDTGIRIPGGHHVQQISSTLAYATDRTSHSFMLFDTTSHVAYVNSSIDAEQMREIESFDYTVVLVDHMPLQKQAGFLGYWNDQVFIYVGLKQSDQMEQTVIFDLTTKSVPGNHRR